MPSIKRIYMPRHSSEWTYLAKRNDHRESFDKPLHRAGRHEADSPVDTERIPPWILMHLELARHRKDTP